MEEGWFVEMWETMTVCSSKRTGGILKRNSSFYTLCLHFVLTLHHKKIDNKPDSGICCAGQDMDLISAQTLNGCFSAMILVTEGFTQHDSLLRKAKYQSLCNLENQAVELFTVT